jgi:diacylglycerol kinase
MTFKTFITSRIAAFGHAFRGWGYVLKTQHNAWIHTLVATIVVAMGLWLGISPGNWAVIILTIAMVFTAEFINTAIEALVDLAMPMHHVLVAALAGVVVGLLILGPPLWTRLLDLFRG